MCSSMGADTVVFRCSNQVGGRFPALPRGFLSSVALTWVTSSSLYHWPPLEARISAIGRSQCSSQGRLSRTRCANDKATMVSATPPGGDTPSSPRRHQTVHRVVLNTPWDVISDQTGLFDDSGQPQFVPLSWIRRFPTLENAGYSRLLHPQLAPLRRVWRPGCSPNQRVSSRFGISMK